MTWSHAVFRDVGVPLLVVAPSGRISSANPAAQELMGRRSLAGTDLGDLLTATDRAQVDAFLSTAWTLPAGRRQAFGPVPLAPLTRDHPVQLIASRTRGEGIDALVVVLMELPAALERPMATPAMVDPLTGVGTRTRGMQELQREVSPQATGCLLVVDLDGFTELNMTFGTAEGDRILAEVARRLVHAVPPGSTVARIDGDQFLALAPRTPLPEADALAGVVLAAMAHPMHIAGTRVVTASIGVAGLAGESADEVLIRAHEALAVAQDQGGRQVVIHSDGLRTFGRRESDFVTEQRIRALEAAVEQARREARTDALTQLPNRRAFDEEVPRLQARVRRTGTSTAALFIDIDEFGVLNSSLGQHRGDMVLLSVASVLAEACRAEDALFRHGGEEFVVLLPEADLQAGLVLAERLRAAVQATAIPHWGRPDLPIVTVSIGVAAGPSAERTLGHLVMAANAEMGHAKRRGRNQVSPGPPAESNPDAAPGHQPGDDVA